MPPENGLNGIGERIDGLYQEAPVPAAAIGEKIAYDAGKEFTKWAARRVAKYVREERQKKVIEGAMEYFLEEYSGKRGYYFRDKAASKILSHIGGAECAFGFLFGTIHRQKDGHFRLDEILGHRVLGLVQLDKILWVPTSGDHLDVVDADDREPVPLGIEV